MTLIPLTGAQPVVLQQLQYGARDRDPDAGQRTRVARTTNAASTTTEVRFA
jgi:hypothetical protein